MPARLSFCRALLRLPPCLPMLLRAQELQSQGLGVDDPASPEAGELLLAACRAGSADIVTWLIKGQGVGELRAAVAGCWVLGAGCWLLYVHGVWAAV